MSEVIVHACSTLCNPDLLDEQQVRAELSRIDTQGIAVPHIVEGSIGFDARVIGAASLPITAQYFLSRPAFGG